WIGSNPTESRKEIESAIGLANAYPETVRAIVVGNEVLLRGDASADTLAGLIRETRQRARVPVTYADVWEFWIRTSSLAKEVDFVTVHILPYWEDEPIGIGRAIDHVRGVLRRVHAAFPEKRILIGEIGWPSAGRAREAA